LNPTYSALYLSSATVMVVTEILALRRRATEQRPDGKHGETVTQHWIWIDTTLAQRSRFLSGGWRLATAGACLWMVPHFLNASQRYRESLERNARADGSERSSPHGR
jgi:hypothetical protein